eukprot:1802552-Pyramimonas_sp.AAC.1
MPPACNHVAPVGMSCSEYGFPLMFGPCPAAKVISYASALEAAITSGTLQMHGNTAAPKQRLYNDPGPRDAGTLRAVPPPQGGSR